MMFIFIIYLFVMADVESGRHNEHWGEFFIYLLNYIFTFFNGFLYTNIEKVSSFHPHSSHHSLNIRICLCICFIPFLTIYVRESKDFR